MKTFIIRFAVISSIALVAFGCARAQNQNEKSAQFVATEQSTFQPGTGIDDGSQTSLGLTVPKGFAVNLFTEGLTNPRRLLIMPGSTATHYKVLVAESAAGRVSLLDSNGTGKADSKSTFVSGLQMPYGMAFHDNWFYMGNTNSVVRFPYQNDQTVISAAPQTLLQLPSGGHWTRNLLFSESGKKMYIAVGSSCNVCEDKENRAAINEANPDGSDFKTYATGIRNPVGMALYPGTDHLWTSVNERDQLGDDTPPDYLTQVQQGAFYGWPYAYTDLNRQVHPDPNFGDKNPDKVKSTTPPTVPLQAHSAALGLTFYPLKSGGPKFFPKQYRGDAFLAFHGSWNRSLRTGYKIVRVHFEKGKPLFISDFVIGFLKPNQSVWGRPVDITVAPDGSLLFSDDYSGKIWRISYTG
ncbi:MAG: sorbosone dehydrogenase family protein [Abditibacteriaceae bacterium]